METGIVFSGGGVRCVAHLAAYQALKEEGIVGDRFSGASAGALVAALLAAGKQPMEIIALLSDASVLAAMRPAFTLKGLLDIGKALAFCLPFLPDTFEQLDRPLSIGTIHVRTGQSAYFSSGPLKAPLLASCCVPVIFNPVEIAGEFYLDGGPVNNLPVEPLQGKCDKIIGLHCNPVDENFELGSMRSMLERTFLLTVGVNVQQRKALCDVFIEPPCLKKYKIFDFKNIMPMYHESYAWIKEQMPQILQQLDEKK